MELDQTRRTAVDVAYREHAADAYRVAFAILRDPDPAVDAVQDAFARAFERWDRYDPARPLRPWLFEIVANTARDSLRRRRVRALVVVPSDGFEVHLADRDADPGRALGERLAVEAGLATLSAEARAAVVLRHYYGYTHDEIARILHVRTGTVGSLLSRSHAVLRTRLAAGRPKAADPTPARSPGSAPEAPR